MLDTCENCGVIFSEENPEDWEYPGYCRDCGDMMAEAEEEE